MKNNEIKNNNKIKNYKNINNKKIKHNLFGFLKLENIFALYIILLPFFDISSFIFRNIFSTNFSPTTFIRPAFILIIIFLIFLKLQKKEKIKIFIYNLAILLYTIVHMVIFEKGKQGATIYGSFEELRFILYYAISSNLLINLYLYIKENMKKEEDIKIKSEKVKDKIKFAVIISALSYILILYITYFTNTATYTYSDSKTGFKGWFESGNVISNILLFIHILLIYFFTEEIYRFISFKRININEKGINEIKLKEKTNKAKKISILKILFIFTLIILISIYMFFLLGTRVGKYGSFLNILAAISISLFIFLKKRLESRKEKKDKKNKIQNVLILLVFLILCFSGTYLIFSRKNIRSNERRRYLEENQKSLLNEKTGEILSVTKKIHDLNNEIKEGKIPETFLSKEEQKALIKTEEIAEDLNLVGHDRRKAQTIYGIQLVKEQKSILRILFGKGYLLTFGEMVIEREIVSIILDFGILGFTLFLIPYIFILFNYIKSLYLNFKNLDFFKLYTLYSMLLSFAVSYLSGALFFPMSSSLFLIILFINTKKLI